MDVPDQASIDVLGLGAVAVDDILYVDAFPPADAKVPVGFRHRQLGGLAGTALVTVARLGGRASYAGVLGDDELSEAVTAGLAAEGVDLTHLVRRADTRPIHSTIVVAHEATRNIFFDSNGVVGADERLPTSAVIRRARVLLVDNFGVAGMIRAAETARAARIPVVADFESDGAAGFADLLGLVDHLILSAGFAERLTRTPDPAEMIARLWGPEREVVAITAGAQGVWYRARDGDRTPRFQPAFRVDAVDSTGCGDVFHGAYALALARGLDVGGRMGVAAAAAAIKATRLGGQAGIPDWATVAAVLDRPGEPVRAMPGLPAPYP